MISLIAFPNRKGNNWATDRRTSELFVKSQGYHIQNLQVNSTNTNNDTCKNEISQEETLKKLSDVNLFLSDSIGANAAISNSLVLEREFNRLAINKTQTYYIHSARLGYYNCLAENFTLADSLTRAAFNHAKLPSLTPVQSLELQTYRAVYFLSKKYCIKYSDYKDWETFDKIKNSCLNEAKKIIDNGLKFARVHNIQDCLYSQYLLSLKEMIQIENIRVYIPRSHSDNETKFSIYKNTKSPASYMLTEYYEAILKNIQHGQIIESLRFLEPMAQVSVDCRGKTYITSALYSLIGVLYLSLNNFSKAKNYSLLAMDIYKSLGAKSFRDSLSNYSQLQTIKDLHIEYENIKQSRPLYAFENALMNQGSIRANNVLLGQEKYAIGNYLPSDCQKFDFDILINELANIYGKCADLSGFNLQTFNDYKINPYIKAEYSVIRPTDENESFYYKRLRQYSSTLGEAKKIILDNIRTTTDVAEKSLFYHYLARCHFYEENIGEAVKAQKQHLELELKISQNKYTSKVLCAQKTLSLLCMLGMWKALDSDNKKQIERYQKQFLEIGEDYMLSIQKYIEEYFPHLNTMDQKALWTPLSTWFYNTITYMGLSNQAAECIYNSSLFSKGLLLSAAAGEIPIHQWQEVRDKLNEDDIAIEFVNFRNINGYEIYFAVTLTKDCIYPSIYPLFSDDEFEYLKLSDEQYYKDHRIYDFIIKPIDIQKNIRNIYFSPTGILHTIAIENLIDSIGKRTCEKWNMYRLSSTRELLRQSNKKQMQPKGNTALIYGNLDYDCSINQMTSISQEHSEKTHDRYRGNRLLVKHLEYSKPEIDTIASLMTKHKLSTILMCGADGTEESFKFYAHKPIEICHLSTHGFFFSDEKIADEELDSDEKYTFLFKEKDLDSEDLAMTRSALVMSGGNNIMRGLEIPVDREDGLLTAMEISELSLKQCDLVSLSACETALGKVSHEGVFGLQRGFKKAGVQSILMSLWEVPDDATCILMQEFYKNIFNGKSKIESLRNAQSTLRKMPEFAASENWAGWVLLDALN